MEKINFSFHRWHFYKEFVGWIALAFCFSMFIFIIVIPHIVRETVNLNLIYLEGFLVCIAFLYLIIHLSLFELEIKKKYLSYNYKVIGKDRPRRSLKKVWMLIKKYNKHHFKQWVVVTIISLSLFLPVRLIFYNYVSHGWLGNLGVMSAIAITLFVLIHYNKIGVVGTYFKNKITRIVFSKIGMTGLFFSFIFAMNWGIMLYMVDQAEFNLKDERNYFFAHLIYGSIEDNDFELAKTIQKANIYPDEKYFFDIAYMNKTERTEHFKQVTSSDNEFKSMFKISSFMIHAMNEEYGAWGSHFATISMVEELEAIGLFFFYRRVYLNKLGESWTVLGLYDGRRIKKFCKQKI